MLMKLLKGLVISVGAGFVMRAGARRGLAMMGMPGMPAKAGVDLTPLLDRLDSIDSRLTRVEVSTAERPAERPVEPGVVQSELDALRDSVQSLDHRTAEQMTALGQRLDDLQSHLPRFIEVKVTARVKEMEERLKAEIQDTRTKAMEAFFATVESKMLQGISVVEGSLAEQSREIGELRQRLTQTDDNLSRVLTAMERLSENGGRPYARFAPMTEAVANGY